MLMSFFKQQKGKQDEEPPSPDQSNVPVPSLLGDGPTKPRFTPVSLYPGLTPASLRVGSMSTPEVNIANAVAVMTRVHRPASRGLALCRTAVNQPLEFATPTPDQVLGTTVDQDTSATTPLISFSSSHSTSNAGRDYGSRNVVQQGDGTKIAIVDSNHVHIHAGVNDNSHSAVLSRIAEKLGSYVVKDAMLTNDAYAHGEPTVCYQHTRTGLLDDILSWVQADHTSHPENAINVSNHTFCIEGAPGSGKSTILNTMVIELLEEAQRREPGLVTAHYMIRRRLQTTTNASKVFTTLVYQLASRSLEVALKTITLLDSIPHTGALSKAKTSQLLLETIGAFNGKVFVIVDALDESSKPDLLAAALSPIIRQPPLNLRLLVATRNEHDVLVSLGADLIPKIVRSIPTQKSYDEVGRFIASRLMDGLRTIPPSSSQWAGWPTVSQIDDLAERADGLYIWATTAVDFILSRVKRRGSVDRDRWIEEVGRIGQGTKNVDALYLFILKNNFQDYEEEERCTALDRMRGVLGFIVTAEHPLALDDIIAFLGSGFDDFDLLHFAGVARSVLVPGTDPITGSTLPQVHKSFSDFITSDRAAEFRVEVQELHRISADRCFALMEAHLRFNICGLRSSFDLNTGDLAASVPKGLIYAATSWWYHLKNTDSQHLQSSLRSIQTLLSENFLLWLEIVSVAGKSSEAGDWLSELAEQLANDWPTAKASDANLSDFARDASGLSRKFSQCILQSIPHIYISLLAFSPRDSIVATHYRNRVATMVIPHPSDIPPYWESWDNHPRMVLQSNPPWSISFSPCACHLATGHKDGSVRVWDVEMGECILGALKGYHRDPVHSVCLSPDGLLLASSSHDGTICVWGSKTGDCIVGPLTDHTGAVRSVSFSPDNTRIASGSVDQSIRVWDARTGQCVLGPLKGHSGPVNRVSYSPNAPYIASSSEDGTIGLWDAQSGECVFEPLRGHTGRVFSTCFSPDGGRLVSGSLDRTLRIWSAQTGTCIHEPLTGHTNWVSCVRFSPNGRYIASGSVDCTIRIWDAEKAECAARPIGGAAGAIDDIAFSPNGKYLAAGSWDGAVRIWDFSSLLRAGIGEVCDGADADDTSTIRDHTGVDPKDWELRGGWTLGPQGERLFWAAQPFSSAIWRPSTIKILGQPTMIKPDLTNLVTGEEWLQCLPSS